MGIEEKSFVRPQKPSFLVKVLRSYSGFFVRKALRSPSKPFAGSFLRSSPLLPDADHLDPFVPTSNLVSGLLRRFVPVSGPHNNAFVSVHHIRLPIPEHSYIDDPCLFVHTPSPFVPSLCIYE